MHHNLRLLAKVAPIPHWLTSRTSGFANSLLLDSSLEWRWDLDSGCGSDDPVIQRATPGIGIRNDTWRTPIRRGAAISYRGRSMAFPHL
jgi:hypothetical protein